MTIFDSKSTLSDINIVIFALFWLLFARNTFFYPSTFSLCVFLNLKSVSYKQYLVESFLEIPFSHSISFDL